MPVLWILVLVLGAAACGVEEPIGPWGPDNDGRLRVGIDQPGDFDNAVNGRRK